MKRLFYPLMLISLVVAGCNSNTIKVAQINDAIDSLKAKFAPDPRVAVFDVKALQSGDAIVVRGEVDNPKAKDALLAALRSENLTDAIDSVVLLPQASLGSKISE